MQREPLHRDGSGERYTVSETSRAGLFRFRNLPNAISLARFPLLGLVVALLYLGTPTARIWVVPLLFLLIVSDFVDGYLARHLQLTSLLGSVLDIAADRAVEQVLWVVLADLDLVPVVIPLIIIPRGILTDAIRAVAVSQGITPFAMMRSRLGRFLVQSPIMRTGNNVVKSGAFLGMAVAYALQIFSPGYEAIYTMALMFSWLGLLFSLLRGLPVIVDGFTFLSHSATA